MFEFASQPDPHTPGATEKTRLRLLDAGEHLFATKGFAETTIRDLTTLAECNVASVNYHFNSKENLYIEVFKRHFKTLREVRLQRIEQAARGEMGRVNLQTIVRAFAMGFIEPLMDAEKGPRLLMLMMREMIHPKLPPGMFFEQTIQPVRDAMVAALRNVTRGLTEADASAAVHSIVGQLVHHLIHVPVYTMGAKPGSLSLEQVQDSLDFIVRFTVAGIRSCVRKSKKGAAP